MAEERQGPLGWTWMGCATLLLTLVPLWFGLTSTFVYLWGKEWWEQMGLVGPTTLFGVDVVWFVAGVQGVLLLLLILALVGMLWALMRIGAWIMAQRARGDATRYASLAGDVVLTREAWADTSNLPNPDEEITEEVE